ncbi:unnamed protein product [Orchesella dallaii]|uniref:Chorein N-terminal domain-containing protein n=1 Tax=Orchesella dallaii TaxID=48710 RepID=A0ABP1PQ90_9HEXA
MDIFRIEKYLEPLINQYFSKYFKNWSAEAFQISIWEGGAVFSNLDLNLEVLDQELQLPLTFASGHVQALKIKVPWRNIASEPIVLNVKSMELVLNCLDPSTEKGKKKATDKGKTADASKPVAQGAGYINSLLTKILCNVQVYFENIVIKYQESDISFSINVGEASLTPTDEKWERTYIREIVYSPDFVYRKKLSFSDVNICLDRCNSEGVVTNFQEPMMYRCDFDVRIIQKFAAPACKVPYFYRMDLFLGHLQFCVTTEQIPMLVRLYHLFTWLMQAGSTIDTSSGKGSNKKNIKSEANGEGTVTNNESSSEEEREPVPGMEATSESWTSWATNWLYQLPEAVFGEFTDTEIQEQFESSEDDKTSEQTELDSTEPQASSSNKTSQAGPASSRPDVAPQPPEVKVTDGEGIPESTVATTHFGIYIKTLIVILREVNRPCDRAALRRNDPKILDNKFLKCSIQGIICDFILRGNENSHAFGVCSIMVHGLGFCPCGVQDCTSSEGGGSSQGGECYFDAGEENKNFAASSLFWEGTEEEPVTEWCYDVNHESCLNTLSEDELLKKTPAFFVKYVVIMNESTVIPATSDTPRNLLNAEITDILYHCVSAPSKALVCSGVLHRLKTISKAINNYNYQPYYGSQIPLPDSQFGVSPNTHPVPVTTYRLVIRQPILEIFSADHPRDYSPVKRAEYFRKTGGIVNVASPPRFNPERARMLISCDVLELTARDPDAHLERLRRRMVGLYSFEDARNRMKRCDAVTNEELRRARDSRYTKVGIISFVVKEALVVIASKPVGIEIGLKSANLRLEMLNSHFFTPVDILQQVKGGCIFDTLTCSTKLEEQSQMLCLPFSPNIQVCFEWDPRLRSPYILVHVYFHALSLYVGPETIISFSHLSEKLLVYLQEFLPTPMHQSQNVSVEPDVVQRINFTHAFKLTSRQSWVLQSASNEPEAPLDVLICHVTRSLEWVFPQRRMLRALTINLRDSDIFDDVYHFQVDYFEECTKTYIPYYRSSASSDDGHNMNFTRDSQYFVSSRKWRFKFLNDAALIYVGPPPIECLARGLFLETSIVPEINISMQLPHAVMYLVNQTSNAGKGSDLSNHFYPQIDGVDSPDHLVAEVDSRCNIFCFASIEGVSRLSVNSYVTINVLDFESLFMVEVMEHMYLGAVVTLAENLKLGPPSLQLVTSEVNLKLGASVMHTLTYSAAMWNQIINAFDVKQCKMVPSEDRPKIILNRVLVCNELACDISLLFQHDRSLTPKLVPGNVCTAWVCPGRPLNQLHKYYFSLDVHAFSEFMIDVNTDGLRSLTSGNITLFANVFNVSASQKMIRISSPLIMANGLDQGIAIDVYSSLQCMEHTQTICVSSKEAVSASIFNMQGFDMFGIRRADTDPKNSMLISFPSLMKDSPAKQMITVEYLLSHKDSVVPCTNPNKHIQNWVNVWVTLVKETIDGSPRYLIAVTPMYCIRSWLCNDTLVHLLSEKERRDNMLYVAKGKGETMEIELKGSVAEAGTGSEKRYLMFQSNADAPPSATKVSLSYAPPRVRTTFPPIDTLIFDITANTTEGVLEEDSKYRWPFVTEDFEKMDWNTEINPETEILVSFSPWIEGLPTAVADIRPWGMFINLSGVELLFAQLTTANEWEQFYVPYKCVFSPKRIAIPNGKFRLGLMLNDFLVKSQPLEFSEQPERLSVIKVNSNWKVPIDCFSRLDLFSGSQMACLTIETKVQQGMLVVIVRPTYSIQNRTSVELYAEGVTLSSCVTQRRESWTDSRLSSYSVLDANREEGAGLDTAIPILHFVTDGHDYSRSSKYFKYLALSCGGPWWFVQLVDCNDVTREQPGIPGTKVAVTLPKVDCKILSRPLRHQLRHLSIASEAVVVGSYTQNGQVWISVSQDNAPQVFIHNKSKLPLFCVEKSPKEDTPHISTTCFEQFLMVPPETSCHFSFQSAYNTFPQLNRHEKLLPDMLMAIVSQDLVDLVTSNEINGLTSAADGPRRLLASSKNSKSPSGNLLFPEFEIDWQTVQSVQKHANQFVTFPNKSFKLSVECVGYTYHVFIEKTKLKQVSAISIRSGLIDKKDPTWRLNLLSEVAEKISLQTDDDLFAGEKPSTSRAQQPQVESDEEDSDEGPPTPPLLMISKRNKRKRAWSIKIYIPELYISVKDNFARSSGYDREFLGVSFEGLYLVQFPIMEDTVIRPAECPMKESWVYCLRICNVQIDTPQIRGLPSEFPVLFQNKVQSDVTPRRLVPTLAFNIDMFYQKPPIQTINTLDCSITLTRVSDDEVNLETVWISLRPCSVFIEDGLLSYIVPSLQRIGNVILEGFAQVEELKMVAAPGGVETEIAMEIDALSHANSTDDQSSGVVSSFYSDKEMPLTKGRTKKTRSVGEGSSLFSRNVSFAPTVASSSSGLHSSGSSIVSSTMSNLRLASVSPSPPSPMVPLEPHGSSVKWPFDNLGNLSKDVKKEEGTSEIMTTKRVKVPKELLRLFTQLSRPVRLRAFNIQPTEVELTLSTNNVVYVALDRSVVVLKSFDAYNSVTTQFHMGLELTLHYTMGTIFTIGNPVRVLGSLELLGSPGTLARTVGTGLRDLVVYPYEGLLTGPLGFVSGLGFGVSSFVKGVTSGSLQSLTNWATSMSRNIDRLTLDQEEKMILESARMARVQGFRDGLVQGISGFGIRLLGAIGGLSHHTIQNVVDGRSTTSGLLGGVGRGVFGVIVRPVGGFAELISMTGQGILLATGWKPNPKAKRGKKNNPKPEPINADDDGEEGGVRDE